MNDQASLLPPLYDMDDYPSCIQNNNYYCKVDAVLNFPPDNDTLLNYIKAVKENEDLYDRSILQRLICAPKESINNNDMSTLLDEKIEKYNLTTNVTNFVCTDGKYVMSFYDKMIWYPVLAYLIFIVLATLYDLFNRNTKSIDTLQNFSMYTNWKKRLIIPNDEDFNRMKSLQGFRGFTMIYVIFGHMMTSYTFFFKNNPEGFEQLALSTKMALEIGLFILSSFLVMSSWITLMQARHIYEKTGKLSFKSVLIRIINRYCRFASSIIIVVYFSSTLMRPFTGPINLELIELTENVCRKNWMYNLFMINNFQKLVDVCNPVSWYVAADFHLYVINLLLVYFAIKYKLNELKLYTISLIVWCVAYGSILYYYEEGPIYQPNLRNNEIKNVVAGRSFLITHTSTFSNGASSAVGLIMGYLYLQYKNATFKYTKLTTILWLILFLGLPMLSVYLGFHVETDRLSAAMLGGLVKPLYAIGMGIGMLGMTFNIGGVIKKVFELKIFLILANFSFATYITNYIISLTTYSYTMPNIDVITIFVDFVRVTILSLALGVFVTLAFEEPVNYLQKISVPQTKTGEGQKKKK